MITRQTDDMDHTQKDVVSRVERNRITNERVGDKRSLRDTNDDVRIRGGDETRKDKSVMLFST